MREGNAFRPNLEPFTKYLPSRHRHAQLLMRSHIKKEHPNKISQEHSKEQNNDTNLKIQSENEQSNISSDKNNLTKNDTSPKKQRGRAKKKCELCHEYFHETGPLELTDVPYNILTESPIKIYSLLEYQEISLRQILCRMGAKPKK